MKARIIIVSLIQAQLIKETWEDRYVKYVVVVKPWDFSSEYNGMQKAVGLQVIECTPIGDGGNLWGVFKKCRNNNGKTNKSDGVSAEQTLVALHGNSNKYYKNPRNYFKFFTKLVKQIKEIGVSRKKTAKLILDSLYL